MPRKAVVVADLMPTIDSKTKHALLNYLDIHPPHRSPPTPLLHIRTFPRAPISPVERNAEYRRARAPQTRRQLSIRLQFLLFISGEVWRRVLYGWFVLHNR